jgi:hypothetical protein
MFSNINLKTYKSPIANPIPPRKKDENKKAIKLKIDFNLIALQVLF